MATIAQYQDILALCRQLVVQHPDTQAIKGGDAYGAELAEKTVYTSRTIEGGDDVKALINLTPPSVRPPFEWLVEISTWGDLSAHFLIYDDRLVEAYGKQVLEVDESRAAALLSFLTELSDYSPTA